MSSTLMHDGGGALKPYEMRELHAIWDDVTGNDAEAAELRRDEPRTPWTAPSLAMNTGAPDALIPADATLTDALVLLGGPLDGVALPQGTVQTAALNLNLPLDCVSDEKTACVSSTSAPQEELENDTTAAKL